MTHHDHHFHRPDDDDLQLGFHLLFYTEPIFFSSIFAKL